jgi:hypothetical protein
VSEDQEKGMNVRKNDDDVEGHMHKSAPAASHKLANDEGDDVEGHVHKNAVNKGMHKNRNINKDDDDVEAHVHLNAVNKGMHKN